MKWRRKLHHVCEFSEEPDAMNITLIDARERGSCKRERCRLSLVTNDKVGYAYASTGSQVQIRFLSPYVLLTRATAGQNLFNLV